MHWLSHALTVFGFIVYTQFGENYKRKAQMANPVHWSASTELWYETITKLSELVSY